MLPIETLDEMIARGWGDVPRDKIPDNWRDSPPGTRTYPKGVKRRHPGWKEERFAAMLSRVGKRA